MTASERRTRRWLLEPREGNDKITIAIQSAVRDALEEHRKAGNPVAVMRDGRVALIDLNTMEVVEWKT